MAYSEIRKIALHFTEEGGYSKSQKVGSRHGTTKVEGIQARGGLTWSRVKCLPNLWEEP